MRNPILSLLVPACLLGQAPQPAASPVPILQRLAQDQLVTAEDFLAAAQAKGASGKAEDALAARELALVAWLKGKPSNLVASAEDVFLRAIGQTPRFGNAGEGDALPTDAHRLDFLMYPLVPVQDPKAMQQERLASSWWQEAPKQPFHSALIQASQASGNPVLSADLRGKLLAAYRQGQLRTPEDLAAAAKVLLRSTKTGDLLLANELVLLAAVRGDLPSRVWFARSWDRAARALGQPARYGTLGSQTMDPGVAPGVIRELGFSGRPTQR